MKLNSFRNIFFSMFVMMFMVFTMGVVSAAITSITVTSPDGGEYWAGTQDITWTSVGCTGDQNVDIYWNTTTQQAVVASDVNCSLGTHSWDTTERPDAFEAYKVKIVSSANSNIYGESTTRFTIDNTDPDANIGSNVFINLGDLTYTITSDINSDTIVSGITSYLWESDDGNVSFVATNVANAQIDSISDDGNYLITLTVTDNAGNDGNHSIYLVYDNVVPTTSGEITSGTPGTNGWYTTNVGYTITPADALSGIASTKYCTDDNNSCTPTTNYTEAITLETEGNNYIRFYSVDNSGNEQTVQSSGLIKIDKTDPSVEAGDDVLTKTLPLQLDATASDDVSDINSIAWTQTAGPGTITFEDNSVLDVNVTGADADGNYTLTLTVTDNAGRENTDTMYFVYDSTAPTIPVANIVGTTIQGDNDTIVITFSEHVVNPADWRLALSIDGNESGSIDLTTANFDYSTDTNALTITLDYETDGMYLINDENLTVTPVEDAIKDEAGNSLADTPVTGTTLVTGDVVAPTVTNVTSTKADGYYNAGTDINVTVEFSEIVDVEGVPYLTLELGEPDRNALYVSGSGTTTLTFLYTVQAGDTSSDLDYVATDSLVGDIEDLAGNVATLTLAAPGDANSLGANKMIVIDTTPPVLNSIVLDLSTFNIENDSTTVTFTFNEDVLQSSFDDDDITADNGTISGLNYESNPIITATFTATAGVESLTNLINVGTNWTDLAGNQPVSDKNSANYVIDTSAPTYIVDYNNTGPVKQGDVVLITVTFSEDMNATPLPKIALAGGAENLDATNMTRQDATSYDYNWTVGSGNGVMTPEVTLGIDLAENVVTNEESTRTTIEVDNTLPTLSPVSIISNNAKDTSLAKVGDLITLTFTSSETIQTPTVTIAGETAAVENTDANDWTATYTMTDAYADGNITFTLDFSDLAGNEGTQVTATTDDTNVLFDKTPPVVSELVLTTNGVKKINDEITLTITADGVDYNSVNVLVNNVAVTDFTDNTDNTYTATYTVVEGHADRAAGEIPVSVTLEDAAGNVMTEAATTVTANTVAIDATKPLVASATSDADPAGAGVRTITVVFNELMDTTTDPVVRVTGLTTNLYTVTKTSYDGNTWVGTFTLLNNNEEQTATITVSGAKDAAENLMDADNSAGTFDVDTVAPVINAVNFDQPSYKMTLDPNVTVTIIEDGTTAQITVDGENADETATPGTWTYTFAHGQTEIGRYSIEIIATDAVGNSKQQLAFYDVVEDIDITEPTIENLSIDDISWNGGIVSADVNDNTSTVLQVWLEFNVVGDDVVFYSPTSNLPVGAIVLPIDDLNANTEYSVVLKVKDDAGNIASDSTTFTTSENGPEPYAIDFPKSGFGFTALRHGDYLASYELNNMSIWDENLMIDTFLNSTAGPDDERLTSDLVDVVYVYDFATSGWEVVDSESFETWNMYDNFTSLNYVVFDLFNAALGLSIRHAPEEEPL